MDRGETTFFTNSETPIPTDLEKVKKIKNLKNNLRSEILNNKI